MQTAHSSEQLSFGRKFDINPRRRLFFGIWPDAGATTCLVQLMERLHDNGIMPGRPVDADRLHLSLHHLGDFGAQIPPSLVPAACAAAATIERQPVDVTFDRIVGTKERLLLLASDGSAALRKFRQTLTEALIKAGLRHYIRPALNPHVTLSYDFSDVPEQPVDPITWTVRHFVLIESLLGKHRHVERLTNPLIFLSVG